MAIKPISNLILIFVCAAELITSQVLANSCIDLFEKVQTNQSDLDTRPTTERRLFAPWIKTQVVPVPHRKRLSPQEVEERHRILTDAKLQSIAETMGQTKQSKAEKAKSIDQLTEITSELLAHENIAHEIVTYTNAFGQKSRIVRILVSKEAGTTTVLSFLADRVHEFGATLEFDMGLLVNHTGSTAAVTVGKSEVSNQHYGLLITGFLYKTLSPRRDRSSSLILPFDAILDTSIAPYLISVTHELRHLENQVIARQRKASPYHGVMDFFWKTTIGGLLGLSENEMLIFNKLYKRMNIDELDSYSTQAFDIANSLRHANSPFNHPIRGTENLISEIRSTGNTLAIFSKATNLVYSHLLKDLENSKPNSSIQFVSVKGLVIADITTYIKTAGRVQTVGLKIPLMLAKDAKATPETLHFLKLQLQSTQQTAQKLDGLAAWLKQISDTHQMGAFKHIPERDFAVVFAKSLFADQNSPLSGDEYFLDLQLRFFENIAPYERR